MAKAPIVRLLAKTEKTETCWLWRGSKTWDGYGKISWQDRCVGTHRLAYELFVGPIPTGMLVMHRCDVPLCVRPDHLFLGTPKDNMVDMVAKGRGRNRDGLNFGSRLTLAQVREIAKQRHWKTAEKLAEEYGITPSHVRKILYGEAWTESTRDIRALFGKKPRNREFLTPLPDPSPRRGAPGGTQPVVPEDPGGTLASTRLPDAAGDSEEPVTITRETGL